MLTINELRTRSSSLLPLSVTLRNGELATIIGPSASGKSALSLAIAGMADPNNVCGYTKLGGVNVNSLSETERARLIGWIPSDSSLIFSGIKNSVHDEIVLSNQMLGTSTDEHQLNQLVEDLDLSSLLSRDPFSLSGGEVVRAALACVLIKKPKLLIVDQAFEYLHADWQDKIWSVVRRLIEPCAFVNFRSRSYNLTSETNRVRDLTQGGSKTVRELAVPKADSRAQGHLRLNIDSLVNSYTSDFTLGPIDLELHHGEKVAVVGPNGAGKTTCLRSLALLNNATWRQYWLYCDHKVHEPPSGKRRYEWAKNVRYAFQNPDDQLYCASVYEELNASQELLGNPPLSRKDHWLELFDLSEQLDISPLDLPRSERRIVSLASVFVSGCPLLLLDEPTVGLDDNQVLMVLKAMDRVCATGRTIVYISHDLEFVDLSANRVIEFKNGLIQPSRFI